MPTLVTIGTPIHSVSQVVVPPIMREAVERDVDLVVVRHVLAADADEFEPVGIHAARREDGRRIGREALARRLRPHEEELGCGHRAQHRAPRRPGTRRLYL